MNILFAADLSARPDDSFDGSLSPCTLVTLDDCMWFCGLNAVFGREAKLFGIHLRNSSRSGRRLDKCNSRHLMHSQRWPHPQPAPKPANRNEFVVLQTIF